MGAEDRAPPDKPDDDWFKQAKERWERQKAEEKARSEEKHAEEEPHAEEEKRAAEPPSEPPPSEHEVTDVEADLREMAASEVAAQKRREESLAPTLIALPEAAPVARRAIPQWWLAGAAGVVAAVLLALVFWPRAKVTPPVAPVAAPPPPVAAPPPPVAAPPPPVAAPPPPVVAAKPAAKPKHKAHKAAKHHAKKSHRKS
jgi:hypothetical protein